MIFLKMGSFPIIFPAVALVIFLVKSGEAIQCFECNSHNDSRCANDRDHLPREFIKDCSTLTEGQKYILCRKISQAVDFEVNGLQPDTRIIRTCGFVSEPNYNQRCYHRSGSGGRQEVCSCTTNECNNARDVQGSAIILMLATVLQTTLAKFLF